MRKVTRNSESPVQKAVWKACFPAHTEQTSLLPEQAQKLHTSGRSNAGKSFSEVYFYLPRSSVLLFVLDINLRRYICLFSRGTVLLGISEGKKKSTKEKNKTQTKPHRFANGLLVSLWQLKATFTVLWDYRILSSLHEKCCYHSVLVIFGF